MELLENIGITLLVIAVIFASAKYIPRIQIAKVSGIPISITNGFMLYVAFLGFVGGWKLFFEILGIYFIVVLHEMSHSLTAQKFGYKVKSIELWPLAGLAMIDGDFTKNPWHEFAIAVAGPALNIVLFLFSAPFTKIVPEPYSAAIFWFCGVNLILGSFNLIPLGVLDGGRIFHSF